MSHGPASADVVLVDGNAFVDGASRRLDVAVRDGRIVAVGDVRELVAPSTEVVRVRGGLVVPGFQDAHAHPLAAGVDLLRCDLNDSADARETLARIKAYAAANPDVPWILGSGWTMSHFPNGTPTRELLDSVLPGRPAVLSNRDGHGVWANSRAFEVAGVDASTPDPPDGRIERDEHGRPAGTLHEGAAALVERHAPVPTPDEQHEGLLIAQQRMFSFGITSWQDAAVGALFGQPDSLPVYMRAQQSGELRARVVGSLWWDRDRGGEQVDELVERRAAALAAGFRATTVKIMQDGVVENFTAGLLAPYLDGCGHATGNSGLSFVDPVALREHVTRLDALGFQVHFHALGDRAVREALDAVEAARAANGPTDGRHHLAHLQVVSPDDVPRFARLDATANMQPLWASHEPQMDDLTIPFIGDDRAALQYPFRALQSAGARLAGGSDWPVSSQNPLLGMHVAVNRVALGAKDREAVPLFPEHALDLATAMTAYTEGSAFVNHRDDVSGRIAVGMDADLAVLDRDPFALPADEIGTARVVATYVAGEAVFSG